MSLLDELCRRCKIRWLIGEIEKEVGVCDHCADTLIAQADERRDWDHFHPVDSSSET